MGRIGKYLHVTAVALTVTMVGGLAPAWAATSTATATVAANVPARAELSLTRDTGSVTRYSASQLVFDRYDDQDGQPDGSPNYMYAPYRSDTGKNWHVASIIANGASMTLTAAVSGTVGSTPLASILSTFCGGLFDANGTPGVPLSGTKSTIWEPINGFTRTLNRPFIGTAPFNYRLNVTGLTAGTYSGQVTFTLTSN